MGRRSGWDGTAVQEVMGWRQSLKRCMIEAATAEMLGMGQDKMEHFMLCPFNFLQLHLRHSLGWPLGSLTAGCGLILGFDVLLGWLLVMVVWPK